MSARRYGDVQITTLYDPFRTVTTYPNGQVNELVPLTYNWRNVVITLRVAIKRAQKASGIKIGVKV